MAAPVINDINVGNLGDRVRNTLTEDGNFTPEQVTKAASELKRTVKLFSKLRGDFQASLGGQFDEMTPAVMLEKVLLPLVQKWAKDLSLLEAASRQILEKLSPNGVDSEKHDKQLGDLRFFIQLVESEITVKMGANNKIRYQAKLVEGNVLRSIAEELIPVARNNTLQLAGAITGISGALPPASHNTVREAAAAVLIAATIALKANCGANQQGFYQQFIGGEAPAERGFLRKLGVLDPLTNELYDLEVHYVSDKFRCYFYIMISCVMYTKLASSEFENSIIHPEGVKSCKIVADLCNFTVQLTLYLEGIRDQTVLARQFCLKTMNTYLNEAFKIDVGKTQRTDFGSLVKAFVKSNIFVRELQPSLNSLMGQVPISSFFVDAELDVLFQDDKKIIEEQGKTIKELQKQYQALKSDFEKEQKARREEAEKFDKYRRQREEEDKKKGGK